MFLRMLKCAVKMALHEAVDEWALESGLSLRAVEALRRRRQALVVQSEAETDARAALALGVEDDTEERPTLPLPSAARVTLTDTESRCPPPGDDAALLRWVHRMRGNHIGWAALAGIAAKLGHALSEEALRKRYRHWRAQNIPPDGDTPPAA